MKRPFRLPLVVMSPKSLLRHPKVVSDLSELTDGQFHEVLGDESLEKAERVTLCSGKLYYDLLEHKESLSASAKNKHAILRVEQLYPYPGHVISKMLKSAKKLKSLVWAQEEPKNMGAWSYIHLPLEDSLKDAGYEDIPVHYVGRGFRASPATGSMAVHKKEQQQIIEDVFNLKKGSR